MLHASLPATTIATETTIELFVALELSSKTWVVATHVRSSDKISQHRVNGGDVASLLALIGRLRMGPEEDPPGGAGRERPVRAARRSRSPVATKLAAMVSGSIAG